MMEGVNGMADMGKQKRRTDKERREDKDLKTQGVITNRTQIRRETDKERRISHGSTTQEADQGQVKLIGKITRKRKQDAGQEVTQHDK